MGSLLITEDMVKELWSMIAVVIMKVMIYLI